MYERRVRRTRYRSVPGKPGSSARLRIPPPWSGIFSSLSPIHDGIPKACTVSLEKAGTAPSSTRHTAAPSMYRTSSKPGVQHESDASSGETKGLRFQPHPRGE